MRFVNTNTSDFDLYRDEYFNPFKVDSKNVIDHIFFYNEEGIVYDVPRGWFTSKYNSNNLHKAVRFVDGVKNKRVIRFDSKETFRINAGKNWDNTNKIHLYIPIEALEGYGYAELETTEEHPFHTSIERCVYVGGDCTVKSHLFYIHISSKREEHWDRKRLAVLHELCTNTTTEEEFKAVLKQFDII